MLRLLAMIDDADDEDGERGVTLGDAALYVLVGGERAAGDDDDVLSDDDDDVRAGTDDDDDEPLPRFADLSLQLTQNGLVGSVGSSR